jgi:hypothetical protein
MDPTPSINIQSAGEWTSDTKGTYDFGNNFDTHPHGDYAGPNLTRSIEKSGDGNDLAIVQDQQEREGRYDILHGGFPTAPSPGGRGKGAEVVDKFNM